MKHIPYILLCLFIFQSCKAQDISILSKELYDLKISLKNHPNSLSIQEKYVEIFPSKARLFEDLFYNKKSLLYEKEISSSMVLMGLMANENESDKIGRKLISICTNFSKDYMDNYNLGGLRYPILKYILSYPDSFMLLFNSMQNSEQIKLLKYLADMENHGSYRYYQEVIDKYVLLNNEIAQLFEKYRAIRQKKNH